MPEIVKQLQIIVCIILFLYRLLFFNLFLPEIFREEEQRNNKSSVSK